MQVQISRAEPGRVTAAVANGSPTAAVDRRAVAHGTISFDIPGE